MLYVVIGLILIIVFVISYGAWMRKKTYGRIDQAETRRVDMMNRPVAKELAKVKQLRMVGDTEKKFEKWRSGWDDIVTRELPAVGESLFKAEGLTDKYRFKAAQALVGQLQKQMDTIEAEIDGILKELNAVVDSESKNRKDVTPVKESYHQIKKLMITRRSQFRKALPLLEKSVKAIDEQYSKYGEQTASGNYIEARRILLGVKTGIDDVQEKIDQVPALYEDIGHSIPDQIRELRQGSEEMVEEGYALQHLQIGTQLEEAERQLHVVEASVGRLELTEASEGLQGIHDQLDWLYNQLEKEALSRQEIREVAPKIEARLDSAGRKINELNEETEMVRDSYHIDTDDIKVQREISKSYYKLEKTYAETGEMIKNHSEAFSTVLEKLKKIGADIGEIDSLADSYSKKIKALRKDELAARQSIHELRHILFEARQMLLKSNIPGVPESFSHVLSEAEQQLKSAGGHLDDKPLNMTEVQEALDAAKAKADDVHSQAKTIVETAAFAEEMIRYGNRYRTDDPEIDGKLQTAEQLFRNYDYQASAETAVRAIEKKEPKILKRVNLYQQHQA
ncbi:septation ring formation regulator EzrA [Sporolactobacillus sp. THM19-2]|uniref:septation ring formation regulator EzrA n=1 Tax=Sporolactobacillus sp. THM19-2 TaxID=2511171 RepID=UPI0010226484|nr:septation ring formation regulator EzrA [Sporolactobacillus sp. THM19-2]RYL94573.1 septation ring formation regulator EzrA [Sporolactobacillus sp. THM19-2]